MDDPRWLSYVVLAFACTLIVEPCLHSQGPRNIHHVTVPLSVEGNAPIATLSFKRPDGGLRNARFIFDSGGGAIILDEGLATDLGLRPEGADVSEGGQRYRAVKLPTTFVGTNRVKNWPRVSFLVNSFR